MKNAVDKLNHSKKKNLKVLEKLKNNIHLIKKRNSKLLLVFVVIALYLRLRGINSGLPYILNADESDNLMAVLGFSKNIFKYFANPSSINISPVYLLLNSIVLFFTAHTLNTDTLLRLLETDSATLFLPFRFLSVLFDIGSIIVVYFIGIRFNSLVAVISSGLLSISMLHVEFCQMFLPFSVVTFFSLLSCLYAIKIKASDKDLTLSMVFAIVSFSIHPIGIISITPLLFKLLQEKSYSKFKPTVIILIIIALLLLNLHCIFHLQSLLTTVLQRYLINYYNYHGSSYFLYSFNFLLLGIGPVAYFGSIWFLRYRKDYDLNLLKTLFSPPILYIGLLGFLHLAKAEYAILIIPYFCIIAGLFFNSIYERAQTDNKKFISILLILFLFWLPLKYTLKYNKISNLSDTRVNATEWIKQNTSENFKIAWDKNSIQPNWYDAYDKQKLKDILADQEKNRQRFPVSLKLLENKDWFKILKKKVDYVVINSLDYEQVLRQPGKKLEKKYYNKILKLKPTIVFNPYLKDLDSNTKSLLIEDLYLPLLTLWQRERGGPVIKIYKL